MNRHSPSRTLPHQNKPPTRIARYRHDRRHPHLLVRKRVLPPIDPFIRREQHVICGLLVVRHDEYRPGIAKLPEVCVFVDFFPGETGVAREEGVAVGVACEVVADVTDCHDEANDGGAAEGSPGVGALGVSVYVKGTVLELVIISQILLR